MQNSNGILNLTPKVLAHGSSSNYQSLDTLDGRNSTTLWKTNLYLGSFDIWRTIALDNLDIFY